MLLAGKPAPPRHREICTPPPSIMWGHRDTRYYSNYITPNFPLPPSSTITYMPGGGMSATLTSCYAAPPPTVAALPTSSAFPTAMSNGNSVMYMNSTTGFAMSALHMPPTIYQVALFAVTTNHGAWFANLPESCLLR